MAGKGVKPSHYKNTKNSVDVIDLVKLFGLNFNIGNVLKYIVRHGKKESAILDLEKAREYLDREIEFLLNKEK